MTEEDTLPNEQDIEDLFHPGAVYAPTEISYKLLKAGYCVEKPAEQEDGEEPSRPKSLVRKVADHICWLIYDSRYEHVNSDIQMRCHRAAVCAVSETEDYLANQRRKADGG